MALITPGHQERASSKVLDPTVPSASKSVARPASACNVCESVTRMDCTSDKPNRPKEHSGFGAQQWSCLLSIAWLVLGSSAPWATTAVDWTPVMEGQALKERADKN